MSEWTPEDFDFPCSDTFRGHYFEHCGKPDPAESLAEADHQRDIERWGEYIVNGNPPAQPQEIIHRLADMSQQEYDLLQQTALKVDHLNKALANHLQVKGKQSKKAYDYSH